MGMAASPPVYGAVNIEQGGSFYDTRASSRTSGGGSYNNIRPSSSQSGGGGGITGLFTGFMDKITGHSEDTDDVDIEGRGVDMAGRPMDDSFDVSVGEEDFDDNVSEDTEEGPATQTQQQYAIAQDYNHNDADDATDERTRDNSTLYGDDIGLLWQTLHRCVYDPAQPEFSSTQQFTWAVVLGIFFGVFTAVWGTIIEGCVEVVWVDVPERLLEAGVFTDLDGWLPLPHYMWICPAVLGGVSWVI